MISFFYSSFPPTQTKENAKKTRAEASLDFLEQRTLLKSQQRLPEAPNGWVGPSPAYPWPPI